MRWRQLIRGLVLFSTISSQAQTVVETPQSTSPEKPSVKVFLTASDQDGFPAMAAQSELSISVDKQPAQVSTLRSAKSDPLLFAVLVDTSASRASSADRIKQAAFQLFQSLATDGNQGYLVLFNQSVVISKRPLQVSEVKGLLENAKFGGGTAVYDAVDKTCIQKLSRSGNLDTPRRAILLISDGDDNQSHITQSIAETTVEKEGVAVFSLLVSSSLGWPQSPDGGPQWGEYFLKKISRDTGGQAIMVKNLADGVSPLLAAIENQASLSFVPAESLGQGLHSLDVKSSKKDIRVSSPAHILVQ
jgi:VWFA-related protein